MPNREKLVVTLLSLLDAPVEVFGKEFFTSAFNPVLLLYEIGELYNITDVEEDYVYSLNFPSYIVFDDKCESIVWLCRIMGIPGSECRRILDKCLQASKITSFSIDGGNPLRTTASAEEGSVDLATAPSRAGERPASLLPPTPLEPTEDTFVDGGRRQRMEQIKRRNRSSTMTTAGRMKQSSYIDNYFSLMQFSGDIS